MAEPDISTLGAILENGYRAACWCPSCEQVTDIDVAHLVANDRGNQRIADTSPQCRLCGKDGHWYVGPDTGEPLPPPPMLDEDEETSEDPADLE